MDVTLMNAVHELLTGCATRVIIEADLFFFFFLILVFVFCLLADSFSFYKAVAYMFKYPWLRLEPCTTSQTVTDCCIAELLIP